MNYLYRSSNSRYRSCISNKKRFPFGHETTKLIREKKKRRAEKNKRRTLQIPEKGNKFPPKRNKEVHEMIGKNQAIEIDRKCSK